MERRIILTNNEANDFCRNAIFHNTSFIIDRYTGSERIRTVNGQERVVPYVTPVAGWINRFSSQLSFAGIDNIWLEWKWTQSASRWEVEFEDQAPAGFEERDSITGWNILLL